MTGSDLNIDFSCPIISNKMFYRFPPVIKHGNGKSPINHPINILNMSVYSWEQNTMVDFPASHLRLPEGIPIK